MITPDTLARAMKRPPAPRTKDALLSEHARDAAVVLAVSFHPEPSLLAVLRGSSMTEHASEVGFPGGKPDPSDADLYATATREMEEEVGLSATDVECMGELLPCPVISGRYLIHPFVAAVREGPSAHIVSATEIERLLPIPILPWMSGERAILGVEGEWLTGTFVAPHFELEGCILYGASAYIFFDLLSRLAAEIGRPLPPTRLVPDYPWGARYG